ncbi:MAG TPA: aquaporin [Balneolaceae bacterium]|nr:aquaporin [Balneolaceae bacterium]|tara:strand:- start:10567 stop:11295 length:729 start_codon:yes stop_codon:yes gene_type:complete
MSILVAEIIGTFLLILLGNGVVANVVLNETKGKDSGWIVITTGWALAVFVGVVVAGPYSGAHLNPAVTFGLAFAGKLDPSLIPTYLAGEFIGAMLGAFAVWLTYKDHYAATEDGGAKLATFSTGPAIRKPVSNLITEIIGTFVLVFVVFYITGAEISTDGTPIGLGSVGAIPVAFLVWVIGISLGGPTGYAINPARDLGPRIMHAILPIPNKGSSDWGYSWIPVVGPIIGAAVAAGIAALIV